MGDAPARTVSILKLFRYATCLDLLLILLGSAAAFLHGGAFPVAMYIFGDITNAFIDREATSTLLDTSFEVVISNCSSTLPATNFSTLGDFTGDPDCSRVYSYPVTGDACSVFRLQDLLSVGQGVGCLSNDLFIAEINRLVYIFLGITVGAFMFATLQIWFFKLARDRIVHRMKLKYYRAVMRQEMAWFDLNAKGKISSHLSSGMETIHEAIGDNLSILVQWVSSFLAAILVGFVREYRLALLLLAVIPFMALAGFAIGKVGSYFSLLEQKNYALAGDVAHEVLGSLRTVQAFGGESREQARYDGFLEGSRRQGGYKGMAVGASVGSVYFLVFLVYSISFWFGAYLVSRQLALVGDIITVFFSILIGAFNLGQSAPNLQKIVEAQGAAGPIYDIIDRIPAIDASSDAGIIPDEFKADIELKGVNFSFPSRPDVQVLKNLDLKISAGEKLALVGASGSGKSTLIKLIQRLYDAESGEVLVGGVNVKELNLKWLRGHIGVVSQEPVLFDTTIAENIRFGREEATLDDIMEAAKKANAHDFIDSLPDGYDTNVGEGGTQLSGGQKQRVAIARALVRDPKILLLDEATSALDTYNEELVQEALDKASRDRTTITIAHRLSTVKDAHLIASMENGRVAEIGTHAELLAEHGIYYDLVVAQTYFYAPRRGHVQSSAADMGRRRRKGSVFNKIRSASVVNFTRSFSRSGSGSQHVRRQKSARGFSPAQTGRNQVSYRPAQVKDGFNPEQGRSQTVDSETVDLEYKLPITVEKASPPSTSVLRLLRMNSKALPVVVVGCVAAMLNAAVYPAFSIIFGEVLAVFAGPLDEVVTRIHPWAAAFLAIGLFSAVATFFKFACFNYSGASLSEVIRSILFKSLLRQEPGWYDLEENSTSILSTKLAIDAGQVQGLVGIRIGSLLESALALLLSVGIALGYSWLTALVILAFMPILALASVANFAVITGGSNQSQKTLRASTELAIESIDNIKTVTTFGLDKKYYRDFVHLLDHPYKRSLCLAVLYGAAYALAQAMPFFGYIITFRFGAFQVIQTPGSILHANFEDVYRVFAAIIFAAVAVGTVGAFVPDANQAKDSAKVVFEIIDRSSSIDGTSEQGVKPDAVKGDVQFRNVTFVYPSRPDVKILDNFNFTSCSIEKKTLALVGASGSGKSTVLSLINRLYDPSTGIVSIDGHDIRKLNLKWLRSQIGIVSQEPVLFDTSITENIRYGALFREVSDEEVTSAAKAANIHSFIETLPQGYSTNVGAKGTQLSGGQKQRIAIARALIRDPKILLLDEATSALDTESEKIVQEALDEAREGRTTIIIAHRLSTIQNADAIAVLEGGVLKEVGTHQSLLANVDGLYYSMVYCHHKAWRTESNLAHLQPPKTTTP